MQNNNDYSINQSISNESPYSSTETINIPDESQPLLKNHLITGNTSFIQSIVNSVNLMVGMALLGIPYTLKIGGWVFGLGLIIIAAIVTCFTSFRLINCMNKLNNAWSLGDLAFETFGKKGRYLISIVYIFELVSCGISY
ncbi:hypothetical protein HDU92_007982, partial [Lobulomyces angularis]